MRESCILWKAKIVAIGIRRHMMLGIKNGEKLSKLVSNKCMEMPRQGVKITIRASQIDRSILND